MHRIRAIGVAAVGASLASLALADTRSYTIDTALSSLTIVGGEVVVGGAFSAPIEELEPGSWVTPLSGHIDADVLTGSIQILGTTTVLAVDHTPYLPGPPASQSTPTLGSFGILYPTEPALGFDFTSITRNMSFSLADAAPKTLASGSFAGAGTAWTIISGTGDLDRGNPPQSDLTTVAPMDNVVDLDGSLTTGATTETITIPVEMTMNIIGGFVNVDIQLEGIIVATRQLPPACPGDVNGDGQTSAADFNILASHYNQSVTPNTNGDLTGDGFVNSSDFNILAGDFRCGT